MVWNFSRNHYCHHLRGKFDCPVVSMPTCVWCSSPLPTLSQPPLPFFEWLLIHRLNFFSNLLSILCSEQHMVSGHPTFLLLDGCQHLGTVLSVLGIKRLYCIKIHHVAGRYSPGLRSESSVPPWISYPGRIFLWDGSLIEDTSWGWRVFIRNNPMKCMPVFTGGK